MKNICVVTSSRADYGILKPLIAKLVHDEYFLLSLVVTGTHLVQAFGMTVGEIEKDGYPIAARIDIEITGNNVLSTSASMANALVKFTEYFTEKNFDLVILLGDRYEVLAICCAAVNCKIPVAHLHGGELTYGALDDFYRHALTKMSNIHFTSCEIYRKRVIQMGEHPDLVFNVGALGVENAQNMSFLPLEELEKSIAPKFYCQPYAVVTFHPLTAGTGDSITQLKELMSAMDAFPNMSYVITKANADSEGKCINNLWEKYCQKRANCYLVASLGMTGYLSAVRYSKMVIGNSSSGILEAPALKVPVINIGDRQSGRIMPETVINCLPEKFSIIKTINTINTEAFQNLVINIDNIYGEGNTSQKIISVLKSLFYENKIVFKKCFYDISF